MPVENAWALQTEEDISIKVMMNNEEIENGRKNIDYNIDTIYISSEDEKFKPNDNMNIKIFLADEEKTEKFNIFKLEDGRLKIEIKKVISEDENEENKNIYKFLEHKLYKINIPKSTFASEDGTKVNREENFYFVTNADEGIYPDKIFKNIIPVNETKAVDYKNGIITFEFIDDISLNPEITSHIDSQGNIDAIENINEYIQINNTDVYNINTYQSDSILNYKISCVGNKLILQSKDDKFKDFAKYTVKIKDKAVFLTKSQDFKVYNDYLEINFYTNDFIEKTVPMNNGTVGVEPTLEIHFKHPISMDKETIVVNDTVSNNIIKTSKKVSDDQKIVYIKIEDEKLESNRKYKVHIPKDTASFKENSTVKNEEINFYFNTKAEGSNPYPIKYSSNQSCTDDIRDITKTNLLKDGSIYIKFNTSIQADKDYLNKDNKNIVPFNDTKLYKITKAKATEYAPNGERFDSMFIYSKELSGTVSQTVYGAVYTELIPEEIPIKDIEIIEPDIIKIKPDIPLLNLNQYEIILDDKIIEDQNGYNLKKENLSFHFWTKADSTSTNPSWNTNGSKVPKTGPIVIDVLGEVIPSAKDFSIMDNLYRNKALEKVILNEGHYIQENTTIGDKEISIELQMQREINLSLSEGLSGNTTSIRWESKNTDIATVDSNGLVKGIAKGSATIYAISKEGNILSKINVAVKEGENKISEFTIQYYYDANNKKHTKIGLDINKELISGRNYKLFIPSNTFQTRSNEYLPSLVYDFVVEGNTEIDSDIEIENVKGNIVSVLDLLTKDHLYFYIYGYNFNSTIKEIVLQGEGEKKITIDKNYITFIREDELKVDLTGVLKSTIAKESNVGEYTIKLIFETGQSKDNSNFKFKITSQGAPTYTVKFPTGENLDEESLKRNGRYFISVTFKDPDGTLRVNGEAGLAAMLDCIVATAGSSETLIDKEYIIDIRQMGELDRDQYIKENILIKDTLKKEATLYIPIKKLRPKVIYQAIIRSGILTNDIAQNVEINWTFGTKSIPHISEIIIGSVIEDYDEDEPIILKGDFLSIEDVSVYFNDIKAEKAEFEDENTLKVFLPDGSDRLDAGIYDIVIKNDENHQTTLYGKLSIVKGGDKKDIPNEEYKIKEDKSIGEVHGDLKVSEDTLYLSSKYSDDQYINLDLDELMGIDTWSRMIKYKGDKKDRIGVLETKSTYGDISLLNLTLDQYAKEDDITIRLGRVEPYVLQNIKSKLKGYTLYSDLIQVSGENFKVDNVLMKIPFRYTSGKNIKVLRYDESTRNFYPVYATVNLVDKRAEFISSYPGIFVVVEA
ncbi:Ig-like domain-containing protein [Lutibacter sp. B2]|nr:Ig-like domain-containing protein [Lutibacter sp. B2]